jgi:hypothetical protein
MLRRGEMIPNFPAVETSAFSNYICTRKLPWTSVVRSHFSVRRMRTWTSYQYAVTVCYRVQLRRWEELGVLKGNMYELAGMNVG